MLGEESEERVTCCRCNLPPLPPSLPLNPRTISPQGHPCTPTRYLPWGTPALQLQDPPLTGAIHPFGGAAGVFGGVGRSGLRSWLGSCHRAPNCGERLRQRDRAAPFIFYFSRGFRGLDFYLTFLQIFIPLFSAK